jgi:hypothetical protein
MDEVEGEKALNDSPSLAYGAAVEAHEVGILGVEGTSIEFIPLQ